MRTHTIISSGLHTVDQTRLVVVVVVNMVYILLSLPAKILALDMIVAEQCLPV